MSQQEPAKKQSARQSAKEEMAELQRLREQNEWLKQQLAEREEVMQGLFSYLTEKKARDSGK